MEALAFGLLPVAQGLYEALRFLGTTYLLARRGQQSCADLATACREASGFSYEDAAAICGCAVGTIKSRVNRARSKLSALLYVEGADDFGPDDTVRAVIGGSGG